MDNEINELRLVSVGITAYKIEKLKIKLVHQITVNRKITITPRTKMIVSGTHTENNNFRYGLVEYSDTENNISGVLVPLFSLRPF